MKNSLNSIIVAGLILFLGAGFIISQNDSFTPLREAFWSKSVPSSILNYGAFGKILKKLILVKPIPNDESRFPTTENTIDDLETLTFQKKRNIDDTLYTINPQGRESLGSTLIMAGKKNKKEWPIFSIFIKEKDLFDPETGIVSNTDKHGRKWERLAEISYIEDGKVLFSTMAGLRLHGGKRRTTKPFNSYRIYFRDSYGAREFPAEILYPDDQDPTPLRTIVLHTTDWPPGYPMNNPLALDITREIGGIAPRTRLVEIYLNGVSLGMGVAIEHMSRKQWRTRWKHDQFNFYRFRSDIQFEDTKMYIDRFWTPTTERPLSFQNVSSSIDLENFTRHIFSWVFCATDDYCQGVAVLDKSNPEAKLFWINWDMDQSFWDHGKWLDPTLKRENWQQNAFSRIYKESHFCGRTTLFTRLINQTEEYKSFVVDIVTELLNHKLTDKFLNSRVQYYKLMMKQFGEPHVEYIDFLEQFMKKRPDYIRLDMKKIFELDGPYSCEVTVPEGKQVIIDGYPVSGDYHGQYFEGQTCTLQMPDNQNNKFDYWLVNGESVRSNPLKLTMSEHFEVKAVLAKGNSTEQ